MPYYLTLYRIRYISAALNFSSLMVAQTEPKHLAEAQMSIRTVKHNLIFILLTCIPYKLQGVFKTTCFGQTSDHLQVYKSLIYTYTLCIDIS